MPGANLGAYFPPARIGNANYVYVMSGGTGANTFGGMPDIVGTVLSTDVNYFGILPIGSVTTLGIPSYNTGMTVAPAYNIDRKVDDGLPGIGQVPHIT